MAFLSNLPFVKNEWVPSDPHKATSDKALRLLSQEAKIHPGFFGQQVPQGLIQAYQFQCGLSPHVSLEKANYGASKVALRGLSQIYRTNIMPIKDVRNRFLDGVLFHFKTAANISSGGARKSDTNLLGFLAYVAAELPYTKGDEICTLLYSINGIVARRGDANLIWLKEIIEGKVGRLYKLLSFLIAQHFCAMFELGIPQCVLMTPSTWLVFENIFCFIGVWLVHDCIVT